MRILITGGSSRLGVALARTLSVAHEVRTLDGPGCDPAPDFVGDPRDRDFAAQAVADRDVVIHLVHETPSTPTPVDAIDLATRGTYNLLTTSTTLSRFVLITSLRVFESYPMDWTVNEQWAPKPTTDPRDLTSYLAEVTLREVARSRPIRAFALRVGEVVDDEAIRRRKPDPRWLHLDDAVQAVERALAFEPHPWESKGSGWWFFHIVGAGKRTRFPLGYAGLQQLGYRPQHDLAAAVPLPVPPAPQRDSVRFAGRAGGTARKVAVFGTNGAFGAVTAQMLARDHVLRLASRRPVQEVIAQNRPQSRGAPLPRIFGPPHEHLVVDVGDWEQVLAAVRGMEGIVNCTVERNSYVEAWRVNALGAYHLARAAVQCGIRRIVQTGPQYVRFPFPAGYEGEFGIPGDAPARAGESLYGVSKLVGQEILRIFAEEHDLEVPVLLWNGIANPETLPRDQLGLGPFMVSWEDTAAAIIRALHAPSFPHPQEVMNIVCDAPMGKVSNERAKVLLGWDPRDRFEAQWHRSFD